MSLPDRAAALVDLLATGELTSLEVTEHYLARIERLNARLRAFSYVDPDGARDRAAAADAAGRPGILHGLPIGDKDLTNRMGMPTSYGSRLFDGAVATASDRIVLDLDAAGAVSVGKTNTPEFGFPCYTENLLAGGVARNPWNPETGPGGSSGGAAVAVAAGMLPVAPGSDGGGSIRIPAAACGLVGVKPSRARVPGGSGLDSLAGLVVAGPLARTVEDAALLLDAMIAKDAHGQPAQPFAVCAPGQTGPYRAVVRNAQVEARPRPLRLAWNTWTPWADYGIDLDPAALAALEHVAEVARGLGHRVEEFTPPPMPEYIDAFRAAWRGGAASLPLVDTDLDRVEPLTAWLVRTGRELSAGELAAGLRILAGIERTIIAAYAPFDAVLTPALAMTPRPLWWFDRQDGERNFVQQCQYTPYTSYVNVAGLPALVLPSAPADLPRPGILAEPAPRTAPRTEPGILGDTVTAPEPSILAQPGILGDTVTAPEPGILAQPAMPPMGVQLIGRPGGEATLFALAATLERELGGLAAA